MSLWKALGLIAYAVLFTYVAVCLVYQFFVHTERVGTLWRPVELVLNTPSHHCVHHGAARRTP